MRTRFLRFGSVVCRFSILSIRLLLRVRVLRLRLLGHLLGQERGVGEHFDVVVGKVDGVEVVEGRA